MAAPRLRTIVLLIVLGMLALPRVVPTETRAGDPAVDPAATKILQRMTDYLGDGVQLQRFHDPVLVEFHRAGRELQVEGEWLGSDA